MIILTDMFWIGILIGGFITTFLMTCGIKYMEHIKFGVFGKHCNVIKNCELRKELNKK